MLDRNNRVSDHPLFAKAEELAAILKDVSEVRKLDERWERSSNLFKLLLHNIDTSVATWVPSFAIEETFPHLSACVEQLTTYSNTGDSGALGAAQSQCENALRKFPYPFRIKNPRVTSTVISELNDAKVAAETHMQDMHMRLDSLESDAVKTSQELKRLAELRQQELEGLKARIENAFTNQNEEFQLAQRERSNEFNDEIEKVKSSWKAWAKGQEDYAEDRQSSLKERLAELEKEHNSSLERQGVQFSQMQAKSKGQMEDWLKDASSLREQIRKIAELSADESLVGKYHSEARTKSRTAKTYRWVSFWVFVVGAVISVGLAVEPLVVHLFTGEQVNLTIAGILARSQLALIMFVPATFLAWDSRKLQREAFEAKELELRISAFPLFISSLEPEEKSKIIQEMAPLFFEKPRAEKRKSSVEGDMDPDVMELLGAMFSAASKLNKQ